MAEQTGIAWTDSTFNPWIGCTKVGPGCDHCYAEADFDHRRHRVKWGAGNPRSRTKTWGDPVKWNKQRFMQCLKCGWRGEAEAELVGCDACGSLDLQDTRRRVFCASLADVFDNEVERNWRRDLFELIVATPNLDWLILTKRVGNAPKMIDEALTAKKEFGQALPNIWLGATVVNQEEADRDIPKLLATPAAVRFLSIEPMLGPVDLTDIPWPPERPRFPDIDDISDARSALHLIEGRRIDWVIVGGESGREARPMHPDWVRSLRDQCNDAGVPFFFKQWGEWAPYDRGRGDSTKLATPGSTDSPLQKFGKKASGNLLDSEAWQQWPGGAN